MMPKLKKREMDRLVEIHNRRFVNCGICPATTRQLIALGLAEEIGGKKAKTGRVVWHGDAHLTDAGRAVLSGLPEEARS